MNKMLLRLPVFFLIASCGTNEPTNKRQPNTLPQQTPQNEDATQGEKQEQKNPSQKPEEPKSETTENQSEEIVQPEKKGPLHLNLVFVQTTEGCVGHCGILFKPDDKNKYAKLSIKYTQNGKTTESHFQYGLNGMENAFTIDTRLKEKNTMLVKKGPHADGLFFADITSIPGNAAIESAILYLTLHKHEGISNLDKSSVLSVYENSEIWNYNIDYSKYKKGEFIREIRAKEDMFDKGVQKFSNPTGAFDFTTYVQKLQKNRKAN